MALTGVKVLELAGLAPVSFCGMILADFGATVIRIDRIGSKSELDVLSNGKKSICLNLKTKKGVEIFIKLCNQSDVLIESYRKGIMEKLGLEPEVLLKENQRLIYARMSGYGQNNYYSDFAAHDINILSLTGLLSLCKRKNTKPTPPINLIGGLGGGSIICAFGIVSALYERFLSGKGQIVDTNMVQGTAYLGSWIYRSQHLPMWGKSPGENTLDCGTHYYDTYETKDGKYVAVGCLEPEFHKKFLDTLNLNLNEFTQNGNDGKKKEILTNIFRQKTQKEWAKIFDRNDACVTPVLSLDGAIKHPQNNKIFQKSEEGVVNPNPAPDLSRTPASNSVLKSVPQLGQHTVDILQMLNYSNEEIETLKEINVIGF